jgi:hypothetical protein
MRPFWPWKNILSSRALRGLGRPRRVTPASWST